MNTIIRQEQQEFFDAGLTLDYHFRLEMLLRFKEMMNQNKDKIAKALTADFGKAYFESYATEVLMIYDELNYMIKNLRNLMKSTAVPTSMLHFYSKSQMYKEPYGNVLVISPWNYPFSLSFVPVIGAIAAGNTVVLKPSEMTPNSAAQMKQMLEEFFPTEFIAVVEGEAETTQKLIKDNFDYIFFTGSTEVGRSVMQSASETLTPVTLELGGKSPTIVAEDADLVKAAVRIAWGKTVNAGQTCIAPDYVLVHESVKNRFVILLQQAFQKLYGEDVFHNDDFPSIINEKHFNRITSLFEDETILYGGKSDLKTRKIEPTIIDEPLLSSKIMAEEIFGPVLPIISYSSIDEVVNIIRSREKPLALYLFTESNGLKNYIVKHISFGGGSINDTLIHFANTNMPFGGIGSSGMGGYHGAHSFDTFSHTKGIMEKTTLFDIPFRYPPYTDFKNKVIRLISR